MPILSLSRQRMQQPDGDFTAPNARFNEHAVMHGCQLAHGIQRLGVGVAHEQAYARAFVHGLDHYRRRDINGRRFRIDQLPVRSGQAGRACHLLERRLVHTQFGRVTRTAHKGTCRSL